MEQELKPFWSRYFEFNWKFGLFLILIVCIPRFILVLHANSSGNYSSIGLIMLISAIAPFVFLTKSGRKQIGIRSPQNANWLIYSFLFGLFSSVLLYFLGNLLYSDSYQNWYQYIGKSYQITTNLSEADKRIMFLVMAITGMTFSPIGEELFFRGIVHESFAKSLGQRKSSIIDSSAFAITHISHFGLVYINNSWTFFGIPTCLWVISMFLISLLFSFFRKKTNSILGAILCHAAFNLGMIYCIFYLL